MHLTHHSHFGAALQQPRRQSASAPSPLAAWRNLWLSAPADFRRDTIHLSLLTPLIVTVAVLTWVMLP